MVRGLKFGIYAVEGYCTNYALKIKAVISCMQLICVLVFAYAKKRFSHEAAHIEGFAWHSLKCKIIFKLILFARTSMNQTMSCLEMGS